MDMYAGLEHFPSPYCQDLSTGSGNYRLPGYEIRIRLKEENIRYNCIL